MFFSPHLHQWDSNKQEVWKSPGQKENLNFKSVIINKEIKIILKFYILIYSFLQKLGKNVKQKIFHMWLVFNQK